MKHWQNIKYWLPFTGNSPYVVDTGSCTTTIYKDGKRTVHEATCIAMHVVTQSVVAVGYQAQQLFGKSPDDIVVTFPIQQGKITHPEQFSLFLQHMCNRASGRSGWQRALLLDHFLLATPSTLSPVNAGLYRAATHSVMGASFSMVDTGYCLVEYYSSLGYRPPLACVIDIGGDVTYVGVFHDGKKVAATHIPWGGMQFTTLVQDHIRQTYGCRMSWNMAEQLKCSLQAISPLESKKKNTDKLQVAGKDVLTNVLKPIELKKQELLDVFQEVFESLTTHLELFFSELPTETSTALLDEGLCLSGGGSQVVGLDTFLTNTLHTTVRLAKDPQQAVVKGMMHVVRAQGRL